MKRSLLVSLFFLLALPAIAQPARPAAPVSNTYGVGSRSYLALSAWNFVPINSTSTYAYQLNPWGIYATTTGATNAFHAGLQLPAGAIVEYVELNICDNSPTGNIGAWILAVNHAGIHTTVVNFANATGIVEIFPCGVRGLTLPAPFTIDNSTNTYYLEISTSEASTALMILGARVGYKLQVSAAPGTATFGDVPTSHPFFRYIEALAASGVTAGCGGGNFCPDLALTRGQMAVFLAKALGLHWAP